jgi:acyl-CoA thioester hydrolase
VFLKQQGLDFAQMALNGISLVVVRIEIDYVFPLRAGDRFVVGINPERVSRVRFGFRQDIYRLPDERLMIKGWVIGTGLNQRGRPFIPEQLANWGK